MDFDRILDFVSQNWKLILPVLGLLWYFRSEILQYLNLSPTYYHNHGLEFKFWTNSFKLIDKSSCPKKGNQNFSSDFKAEKDRSERRSDNPGFLDFSQIGGLGITDNGRGGYFQALEKIGRLLDQVYFHDGKKYKENFKSLIGTANRVIDRREKQLNKNKNSDSFENHKNTLEEWKKLKNRLIRITKSN